VPSPDSQDLEHLQPVQRTVVHAVVRNAAGSVLLVRASLHSDLPDLRGRWFLPGGALQHGEHPRDGVLRTLAGQTGLRATEAITIDAVDATSDVADLPYRGVRLHTLRLIYDVELPAELTEPADQFSELVRFVGLDDASRLPLMPVVAEHLALPEPEPLKGGFLGRIGPAARVRVQRPAAYAVLIDEAAADAEGTPQPKMLLSRLAGEGVWTLPGGGIDHGEHPLVALKREIYEETGLPYVTGPLLDIGSRHFVGRSPSGRREDFHGLRLIYAGSVPVDQPPQVIEVAGSTDLSAWIPLSDLDRVGVVSTVRESLAIWQRYRAGTAAG
jgi:8-oxo-dGTP diphosphatase